MSETERICTCSRHGNRETHIKRDPACPIHPEIARRCAWCWKWYSPEDQQAAREGAPVSGGMCDDCWALHFGEVA